MLLDRIKKVINTEKSIDVDLIKDKIKNYKYVSFDIFDTVLKRNVLCPTDVFRLMEKSDSISINNFKNKRVEAEQKARNLLGKKEITLNEIYSFFDEIDEQKAKELVTLELLTESEVLTANKEMIEILNF